MATMVRATDDFSAKQARIHFKLATCNNKRCSNLNPWIVRMCLRCDFYWRAHICYSSLRCNRDSKVLITINNQSLHVNSKWSLFSFFMRYNFTLHCQSSNVKRQGAGGMGRGALSCEYCSHNLVSKNHHSLYYSCKKFHGSLLFLNSTCIHVWF